MLAMNRWTRRSLVAGLIASPAVITSRGGFAAESAYPARTIQFMIPYAPGGGFDVYVRVIAPVMEEYLPHRVNIVPINVAGGGGSKGTVQLYRARPDGYSIGICVKAPRQLREPEGIGLFVIVQPGDQWGGYLPQRVVAGAR